MWQEAALLNGELTTELRGKNDREGGGRFGLPLQGSECAGMGLGEPASELNLMRVVKGEIGLYGYCAGKIKARASANLLLEGAGDLGTWGMGKG